MATRKKTSPLEDILDLMSLLPWWVCLVLAAVSYAVLSNLAAPIKPSDIQGQGGAMVGVMMQKAITHGLATIGQYLAPLMCLIAAAISAWRRKQRRELIAGLAQAESSGALDDMGWREFEILVGESYRQQGYQVAELGGAGPDGGVDLVLTKGNEKFFVQCKQWKAYRVGVTTVRELYGVMAAKGATGGFIVTSGRFTADAMEFAQGRNIELVDGPRLFAMIQLARRSGKSSPSSVVADSPAQAQQPEAIAVATAQTASPECPRCGAFMQLRTARQGANAGSNFWGCSTYPKCRGTRAAG